MERAELEASVSRLLGSRVSFRQQLTGGRNSRVYRLISGAGDEYVAKVYFRHPEDPRRRLEVEFGGLGFLWNAGERAIPEPLVSDPESGWALYRHVEGAPVEPRRIDREDIDQAVAFQTRLIAYGHERDGRRLPNASESCFSAADAIEHIERRLARLRHVAAIDPESLSLHRFLDDRFEPTYRRAIDRIGRQLTEDGDSLRSALPISERTLSASDFSLHNALKTPDGRIVFVDFEHFGWDDPAKLTAIFAHHPAMSLDQPLQEYFCRALLPHCPNPRAAARRFQLVRPFFVLTWALILLNEFVTGDLERRRFAEATIGSDRRATQLAKAETMMEQVAPSFEPLECHA